MIFTSLGIFVVAKPWMSLLEAVSMMALQFSRESYLGLAGSMMNDVILSHPPKGDSPSSVIFADMVTLLSSISAQNVAQPKEVTELGMTISFSAGTPLKDILPNAVTSSGIMVLTQPMRRVLVAVSMMALHLSRESNTVLPASTLSAFRLRA